MAERGRELARRLARARARVRARVLLLRAERRPLGLAAAAKAAVVVAEAAVLVHSEGRGAI